MKNEYTVDYLYKFVSEQIRAGLFKSNIVDKLLEMGVKKSTAVDLVEEMERKLRGVRKKRILIVEDEPHNRMLLLEILRAAGYKIYQAEDGKIGFDMLKEIDPDLVITDVLMPRMKGNELIKKTRRTILFRDLPFIVLTERGLMKDYFDSLSVDAFVDKPFSTNDLLNKVKAALSNKRKIR